MKISQHGHDANDCADGRLSLYISVVFMIRHNPYLCLDDDFVINLSQLYGSAAILLQV